MGANNTPLPDLIELSSIGSNATFTAASGGGGDIIGVVDNATYTDGDSSNSSTQIAELNETFSGNGGTITIDGTEYNIQLIVPDGFGDDVTVTYNNGASSTDLSGSGGSTDIAFIVASPVGGGSDRYFAAIDDGVGDLPDITSIQTRDLDFSPAGDDVSINLEQNQNVAPVCYTPGTRILTPKGNIAIEMLRAGDLVVTADDGHQPIRWTVQRTVVFAPETEKHKPIQIKAGALGRGVPWQDMAVSPQHRLFFQGKAVRRLFGVNQVLARANGLTGMSGVRVMKGRRRATYINILLDRHHVITAEGVRAESFYPGPMALQMLSRRHRNEIEAIFPNLLEDPAAGYGSTARLVLTRQETELLAQELNCAPALPKTVPSTRFGREDPEFTFSGFAIRPEHPFGSEPSVR